MTDYGMRKKARGGRGLWLGLVVFLVLAAVVGHLGLRRLQPGWIAEAARWTVQGPPCAPVSAAVFKAQGAPINETFEYDGAVFARAFGQGSCAQIHDHGGKGLGMVSVCQFSSPMVLRVHAGKADTFYVVQAGKPLTVTIDHGALTCVLAAREFPPSG
jgi:hypothetical protein